jgi:HAE1 family hydrophobic/amphiphilic exporter-1
MMKVILSEQSRLSPESDLPFLEATDNIEGLELSFKQDDHSLGEFLGRMKRPLLWKSKGKIWMRSLFSLMKFYRKWHLWTVL